jgi:transcription elongation GreA/GreB family factor
MSRAFVKEIDDAPEIPHDRAVSAAPNRVTPRGAGLIVREIAALEQALAATPDGERHAALRRDLRYWMARHTTMQVVPADPAPARAGFGTVITIRRGGAQRRLIIVGEDEADPAAGLLAWTAPLARALDGAEAGDVVEFEAAGKTEPVTVLSVESIGGNPA